MLDNPFSEEFFPDFQSKSPLEQFETISCLLVSFLISALNSVIEWSSNTAWRKVIPSLQISNLFGLPGKTWISRAPRLHLKFFPSVAAENRFNS